VKKPVRVLVILIALGLSGFVIWQIRKSSTARSGGVDLVFSGNVDIREAELGFRVSGRISEVLVEEGDAVKNSAVLAKLDPEPFERSLDAAKAQVASAEARLMLLKRGYRPEEIAQARAALRERAVFFENAKTSYLRKQELLKNRTISQQEFDEAEAQYREAEARLNSAKEQLALFESGFRQEEIAAAEADLQKAQAGLATAQLQLKDTTLVAPDDGTILTRGQEPGAIVQPGETVLTLALRDPVWVRAYVHEPELGRISPGMRALIKTDSRPERPYEGQIGYISPRAEFTPRNVETTELRTSLVYRFRVIVQNPDEGLRQGMPVTVEITPARD
jgi:HlyD family secretion protein